RLDVGAAVASAQRAVEDDVALIRSDRDAVDLVELVAGLDQFSGCNMDTRQCSWQAGPQQRRRSRRSDSKARRRRVVDAAAGDRHSDGKYLRVQLIELITNCH